MLLDSAKLDSLKDLAGPANFKTDEDSRLRLAPDGIAPQAVVEPESAEQLAEIVRWARKKNAALIPATSGRFLPLGNPPRAADLAVSLARMRRVVAYDPGDLTLSVEAGATLADINPVLTENNQFLPSDPPFADEAALGGLLAANVNGPLRHAFGTWRDFVVGLHFVTGEGNVIKAGGRVVKNVAGYDLTRLMIGALGSLGILTQINLRVFPLPEQTATFLASFDSIDDALEMRMTVVHSQLQPSRLELLDGNAAGLLGLEALPAKGWHLLLSCGGVEAVIGRHRRDLERFATESGATAFSQLTGKEENGFWQAVCNLLGAASAKNPLLTVVKCPLPMTGLGPFISRAVAVAERYELPTAVSAHAGVAVAYIYYLPEGNAQETAFRAGQAATETVHAGNNLQGRVTLPWCRPEVKQNVNPWGPLKDDFALMKKLKKKFDPDGILNPGRFAGGL